MEELPPALPSEAHPYAPYAPTPANVAAAALQMHRTVCTLMNEHATAYCCCDSGHSCICQ